MRYKVISRFWDEPRGVYVDPGQDWTPASEEQAARYLKAGCLVAATGGSSGGSGAGGGGSGGPAADPLERMNKDELLAEAEKRGVEVDPASTKKEIRAALEAAAGK